MNEFLALLDELADAPITPAFLARLSGATRPQGMLFAQRLAQLPEVRRLEIIASMAHYGEEDFALHFDELYRACLSDESAPVRRQCVRSLWEDERPDLAFRLIEMLHGDPSAEVRAAAATGLGSFLWLAEIEELDETLALEVRQALELCIASEQEPIEVRRRAVEAIAFINDDVVKQIIDRAYADEDPLMRISAVFAMGRSADHFWAETVQAELYSDSAAMRYEAVRACGEIELKRATPNLIRMAYDGRDPQLQLIAVWALGKIGGDRARNTLAELMESDNEDLAEAAGDALDELNLFDTSFDLLDVDLEHQQLVELGLVEDDDSPVDETALAYRREFGRYLQESEDEDEGGDEDEGDDEDWPDEFLEIG
jgi:hypothetical protein